MFLYSLRPMVPIIQEHTNLQRLLVWNKIIFYQSGSFICSTKLEINTRFSNTYGDKSQSIHTKMISYKLWCLGCFLKQKVFRCHLLCFPENLKLQDLQDKMKIHVMLCLCLLLIQLHFSSLDLQNFWSIRVDCDLLRSFCLQLVL